jgi:hypothetical protein
MYGKKNAPAQRERPKKYVSFSLRERARESLFAGFRRRKTERGGRDGVVCVVVLKFSLCRSCAPSTRALKGKETGLFLSLV